MSSFAKNAKLVGDFKPFATISNFSLGSFKAGMALTIKILWNKNKTEIDKIDINMAF